jgi:hypothetical protein
MLHTVVFCGGSLQKAARPWFGEPCGNFLSLTKLNALFRLATEKIG